MAQQTTRYLKGFQF